MKPNRSLWNRGSQAHRTFSSEAHFRSMGVLSALLTIPRPQPTADPSLNHPSTTMAATRETMLKVIMGTSNWALPMLHSWVCRLAPKASPSSISSRITTSPQSTPQGVTRQVHMVHARLCWASLMPSRSSTVDAQVLSDARAHRARRVSESVKALLEALGANKVGIMDLRWPDRTVRLSEPLRALDQAHR